MDSFNEYRETVLRCLDLMVAETEALRKDRDIAIEMKFSEERKVDRLMRANRCLHDEIKELNSNGNRLLREKAALCSKKALNGVAYKVSGRGSFPLDMLRRDGSYPSTPLDVSEMEWTDKPERRTVQLVMVTNDARRQPNVERWASFGWDVIEVAYLD